MLRSIPPSTWPSIGLSVLLMIACLVGTAYINHLQAELGDSFRADTARLQAAQQAQIHLREYRVHTIVQAAGPTVERSAQVAEDRREFLASLATLEQLVATAEDHSDLADLRSRWEKYESEMASDLQTQRELRSVEALALWTDAHRMRSLMMPCNRLVERSQVRMSNIAATSETQTRWTGRFLLLAGFLGPLAGIVGGYTTARILSRRVARLFVRVQAAQSHFDQDVGAFTLDRPDSLGDLDQQLGAVVDRVGLMCRRLHEQERDLLRAEQLAAVGHLAAGIAHEIRNPLTGIKMMVEAAVRPSGPSPLTSVDLGLIRDEITRLERTVQGLLDYAKPAVSVRRPQDVGTLIERAIGTVAAQAERTGVTVFCRASEGPLVVRLDPDQFLSLLTNLLRNALDATPSGGLITVSAVRSTAQAVVITLTDTGAGIPAEISAILFTPFATTKPTGTGLGLVVARRIATDHGGTLVAGNGPEGGAVFTLTLPAGD